MADEKPGLMYSDRANLEELIANFWTAFTWAESREGHAYWQDVVDLLELKVREGKL